ncbi:MAG: redoxin domain-containing protein [Pyrinomonadaceae bacterium]
MPRLLLYDNLKNDFPVEIGTKAPDFTLENENGEKWSLSDKLGEVVALLFYPQNETLVCTKQLCSVRDHWEDYLKTKATIVGISPGMSEEHKIFSQRHSLPLSLLADSNREITRLYSKHWLYPISFTRAIVVVDAKGFIRSRKIMLRAFRPADKNVITSIYSARSDAMYEKFDEILSKSRAAKAAEKLL